MFLERFSPFCCNICCQCAATVPATLCPCLCCCAATGWHFVYRFLRSWLLLCKICANSLDPSWLGSVHAPYKGLFSLMHFYYLWPGFPLSSSNNINTMGQNESNITYDARWFETHTKLGGIDNDGLLMLDGSETKTLMNKQSQHECYSDERGWSYPTNSKPSFGLKYPCPPCALIKLTKKRKDKRAMAGITIFKVWVQSYGLVHLERRSRKEWFFHRERMQWKHAYLTDGCSRPCQWV